MILYWRLINSIIATVNNILFSYPLIKALVLVNEYVLSAAQVERHSNCRYMIGYHMENIRFCVKYGFQKCYNSDGFFGIVSAATIPKNNLFIRSIERDTLWFLII